MAKVNFIVRSAKGRLRNVSPKPELGGRRFRELFADAHPAGPMPGNATDQLSLLHVTRVLEEKLKSSGGRPALERTEGIAMRVSLMEGDRSKIEAIAKQVGERAKLRPSPAQVVAVLCHLALQRLPRDEIEQATRKLDAI